MSTVKLDNETNTDRPYKDSVWWVESYPSGGVVVKAGKPRPWRGAHYRIYRSHGGDDSLRFRVAHSICSWLNGGKADDSLRVRKRVGSREAILANGISVCAATSGNDQPGDTIVCEKLLDAFVSAHSK